MRQNHRGPVGAPFLWFRARPKPPRSGVLDQATLALVPLNLDGYPTPQDPVRRLVSIDVKSGVEKQLATLDPPPDSILAGRISLSSGRQPTRRLVCPPARQDLHARRLRRIHILVRPTDAAILAGRNGSGPAGRQSGHGVARGTGPTSVLARHRAANTRAS